MSLLKRIESARPGAAPEGSNLPAPTAGGTGGQPPAPTTGQRLGASAPVRESFRDVKFRIQSRVIQDLDPKLDLTNQVEVRRQRIDHRRLLLAAQLDDAELGPVGPLPHEFGIDGDEGFGAQPLAQGGEGGGGGDQRRNRLCGWRTTAHACVSSPPGGEGKAGAA